MKKNSKFRNKLSKIPQTIVLSADMYQQKYSVESFVRVQDVDPQPKKLFRELYDSTEDLNP